MCVSVSVCVCVCVCVLQQPQISNKRAQLISAVAQEEMIAYSL